MSRIRISGTDAAARTPALEEAPRSEAASRCGVKSEYRVDVTAVAPPVAPLVLRENGILNGDADCADVGGWEGTSGLLVAAAAVVIADPLLWLGAASPRIPGPFMPDTDEEKNGELVGTCEGVWGGGGAKPAEEEADEDLMSESKSELNACELGEENAACC